MTSAALMAPSSRMLLDNCEKTNIVQVREIGKRWLYEKNRRKRTLVPFLSQIVTSPLYEVETKLKKPAVHDIPRMANSQMLQSVHSRDPVWSSDIEEWLRRLVASHTLDLHNALLERDRLKRFPKSI